MLGGLSFHESSFPIQKRYVFIQPEIQISVLWQEMRETVTKNINLTIKKLRPHHVFCKTFLTIDFTERGEEFKRVSSAIKELIASNSDAMIEIIQGVDGLCRSCPDCRDDRCESANGNEDEVRKWDAIILKGLGISYGEKRTIQDLREIIGRKAPLDFCRTRCPWKTVCTIFNRT